MTHFALPGMPLDVPEHGLFIFHLGGATLPVQTSGRSGGDEYAAAGTEGGQ